MFEKWQFQRPHVFPIKDLHTQAAWGSEINSDAHAVTVDVSASNLGNCHSAVLGIAQL